MNEFTLLTCVRLKNIQGFFKLQWNNLCVSRKLKSIGWQRKDVPLPSYICTAHTRIVDFGPVSNLAYVTAKL